LVPATAHAGGREHRIVLAGRQERRKGLHVLLRAWPEIRRRTNLRLTVAGADPLAVRLLLTRLRVSDDGIDVVGFLSQDELTQTLLDAKALVAPSVGRESFGMVLTRAFACALPAVASDIPGYREVLTPEAAVAVPADDHAALVEAVSSLVEDEARRERMGEEARALAVERYAWPTIARRLEGVYERVTGLGADEARAAGGSRAGSAARGSAARSSSSSWAQRRLRSGGADRTGVRSGTRSTSSSGAGSSSPSSSTSCPWWRGRSPGSSRSGRRSLSRIPATGT